MLTSRIKKILSLFFVFYASSSFANEENKDSKSYLIEKVQVTIIEEKLIEKNFKFVDNTYLGKKIRINNTDNIERYLARYFSNQGYLVPQVVISEQDLQNGFLNIYVQPGKINDVIIKNSGPENELINKYVKDILSIENITMDDIRKYITLMNRIPGYDVDYEFHKTAEKDLFDLVLIVQKDRANAFISVDSYGSNDLGQMQNFASVEMFNSKGGSDSWTFSGFTTNHPDRLYFTSIDYKTPINTIGTNATITASYSENNSSLEDAISSENGNSASLRGALDHILYMNGSHKIVGEIGTTYTDSNGYTLDSSNKNVDDTKYQYASVDTTLTYSGADAAKGFNIVSLSFNQGLGGTIKNYTTPSDSGDKHYNFFKADIRRYQSLFDNFSIYSRISGAYSGDDLPSPEQFSLGGRSFGRGYESGTLVGNRMLAASFELRYDYDMQNNAWFQNIQPYIFRDMGYIGKQDPDTDISHLSSYGGGVRLTLIYDISIQGEVAKPTKSSYVLDGDRYYTDTIYGASISKSFRF